MSDVFVDKLSNYKFIMKMNNPTSNYIINTGIYEYNLINWCKQFLDKDKIFLDIGAHMGTYSIILSDYCKHVYSFEAQKNTYYNLCGGIALNNKNNITAIHTALGNKEDNGTIMYLSQTSDDGGTSTMDMDVVNNTNSDILNKYKVKVTSLDSYNLNNIGFIKIDVEGWEINVLKGAEKTLIRNSYPQIIFEVWDDEWYINKKNKLLEYLDDFGYNCKQISGYSNMYIADHKI